MIAMNRGRKVAFCLVAAAAIGGPGAREARAQGGFFNRGASAPAKAAQPAPAPAPAPAEVPALKEVRVPTNATDPIAIVNNEVITRQQLADECVARKGQEILDTLIARRLIEQAMRAQKMEVTPKEIDDEIDSVAMRTAGVTRDVWLRNLDKERGISPAQYARDIIYPALALRKLAVPRVQVTEQDIKDAFEANFGPRLRCRMILCKDIRSANEIWEELRKNPAGFEKLAKDRSMDTSTRATGGVLPEPIARHAVPRDVTDGVFAQLVDGDPKDSNPAHKPKDGDFTGPIQLNEAGWMIIRREEVVPGKSGKLEDPNVKNMLQAQMFDVKLNAAMSTLFEDLMKNSSIDNKLTGQVKMAREEEHPDYRSGLDAKVQRMSAAGETQANPPAGRNITGPTSPTSIGANRAPAGVPAGAAATATQLQQTIRTAPRTAPPGN